MSLSRRRGSGSAARLRRGVLALCVPLVLAALLFPSCRASPPRRREVFRADKLSPSLVKQQGGLLLPGNDLKLFSLFDSFRDVRCGGHMCRRQGIYLPTTDNSNFAELELGDSPGYLYFIHATPNFVDVSATLGEYYPDDELRLYAALGDIRWSQIAGWIYLPQGLHTSLDDRNYEVNADCRPLPGITASGAVPKLAGFPSQHEAWGKDPWKDARPVDGKERDSVVNFVVETENALQWPSLFDPSYSWRYSQIRNASGQAVAALGAAGNASKTTSERVVAATRADNAAAKSYALTRKLAKFVQCRRLYDRRPFDKAWTLTRAARMSALNATLAVDKDLARHYHNVATIAHFGIRNAGPDSFKNVFRAQAASLLTKQLVRASTDRLLDNDKAEQKLLGMLKNSANADLKDEALIYIPYFDCKEDPISRELEVVRGKKAFLEEGLARLLSVDKETSGLATLARARFDTLREDAAKKQAAKAKMEHNMNEAKALEAELAEEAERVKRELIAEIIEAACEAGLMATLVALGPIGLAAELVLAGRRMWKAVKYAEYIEKAYHTYEGVKALERAIEKSGELATVSKYGLERSHLTSLDPIGSGGDDDDDDGVGLPDRETILLSDFFQELDSIPANGGNTKALGAILEDISTMSLPGHPTPELAATVIKALSLARALKKDAGANQGESQGESQEWPARPERRGLSRAEAPSRELLDSVRLKLETAKTNRDVRVAEKLWDDLSSSFLAFLGVADDANSTMLTVFFDKLDSPPQS